MAISWTSIMVSARCRGPNPVNLHYNAIITILKLLHPAQGTTHLSAGGYPTSISFSHPPGVSSNASACGCPGLLWVLSKTSISQKHLVGNMGAAGYMRITPGQVSLFQHSHRTPPYGNHLFTVQQHHVANIKHVHTNRLKSCKMSCRDLKINFCVHNAHPQLIHSATDLCNAGKCPICMCGQRVRVYSMDSSPA